MIGKHNNKNKIDTSVRTITKTVAFPVGIPALRKKIYWATSPPVAPGVNKAKK